MTLTAGFFSGSCRIASEQGGELVIDSAPTRFVNYRTRFVKDQTVVVPQGQAVFFDGDFHLPLRVGFDASSGYCIIEKRLQIFGFSSGYERYPEMF